MIPLGCRQILRPRCGASVPGAHSLLSASRYLSSGPIVNHVKIYSNNILHNENAAATGSSSSKLESRYPSFLGVPPSYPSPDDSILKRQQRVLRSTKRARAITVELLGTNSSVDDGSYANGSKKPLALSAKLASVALLYAGLVGGAGILLLHLFQKQDVAVDGGGARKQHHIYPVSITVISISAVLFAAKVLIPSLRPALVKYGYINLPIFALVGGKSTRISPHMSLIVSHFSQRSFATLLTSTLMFALFAGEAEYLVNPTALTLALISGVSVSCFSACFLPLMLGGKTMTILSPVSGSYALACAALGFISTFEDAGDIPRVFFYLLLAGSAFRVIAKSKATTSKRQCCSAAFFLGGLLGGRLVGMTPNAILFVTDLWNERSGTVEMESLGGERWKINRRQFWGMHTTDGDS
ncbi:hypothetical protein POJ06DRAFT_6299 [Lipomyces tetrasporus]|uniref:Uncharacterized protein n=1 Tax=Lipomyces tetrasporus TaxID=54092 RepID=A0AAD7QYE3_9ASCO|nr:uncharacterized protein POJ06DRAFT_6299 [Lipomyces tetrasporus]KAJ8103738.1 hypothetical protein POJ06DRAFT_6299 [Lipomyces tetrasporus]